MHWPPKCGRSWTTNNAMAEFRLRMFMNVGLNLIPVPFVITNLFAMHANGKQTA
jgi:hypothetical protein